MNNITASQVMRYKKITGIPTMDGKRYLQNLSSEKLDLIFKAIEIAEQENNRLLRDPREDNPKFKEVVQIVEKEVEREVNEYHNKRILELEETSPAVADLFRTGRGLCHRFWYLKKQKLWESYGIDWMTPVEMNSHVIFDR